MKTMKATEINSVADIDSYIDRVINDFEAGVTDKEDTRKALFDLVIRIHTVTKNGLSIQKSKKRLT